MAGAYAGDDQGVDPQRREHLMKVSALEGRGVALPDQFLAGPPLQARVEIKLPLDAWLQVKAQLLILRARRISRIKGERSKEHGNAYGAGLAQHAASVLHDKFQIAANLSARLRPE